MTKGMGLFRTVLSQYDETTSFQETSEFPLTVEHSLQSFI